MSLKSSNDIIGNRTRDLIATQYLSKYKTNIFSYYIIWKKQGCLITVQKIKDVLYGYFLETLGLCRG